MHKPDRYDANGGTRAIGCRVLRHPLGRRLRALFLEPMGDAPPPIRPEQAEARQEGATSIGHLTENLGRPPGAACCCSGWAG